MKKNVLCFSRLLMACLSLSMASCSLLTEVKPKNEIVFGGVKYEFQEMEKASYLPSTCRDKGRAGSMYLYGKAKDGSDITLAFVAVPDYSSSFDIVPMCALCNTCDLEGYVFNDSETISYTIPKGRVEVTANGIKLSSVVCEPLKSNPMGAAVLEIDVKL